MFSQKRNGCISELAETSFVGERGCMREINGPIQPITAMTVAVMVWKWTVVMWIPFISPGLDHK